MFKTECTAICASIGASCRAARAPAMLLISAGYATITYIYILNLIFDNGGLANILADHAGRTVSPQTSFFGRAHAVVFQITNVPYSHSDKVPIASVPGIRPVCSVNWWYTRYRGSRYLITMRIRYVCNLEHHRRRPTKNTHTHLKGGYGPARTIFEYAYLLETWERKFGSNRCGS